jgi:putative molybdopterin biosynthesis protein
MTIYLQDIPLPQAKARLEQALEAIGKLGVLGKEEIPLDEHALGRVLAQPIWARLSSPHYHASAMDGYAVRSESTASATPANPVDLMVGTQSEYVDTGDPLPGWSDSVIPVENIEHVTQQSITDVGPVHAPAIRIRSAVTPWSHVRTMGEDIVATQLVLPSGHTLRPVDLGAIAASGHASIHVEKPWSPSSRPTELVPVESGSGGHH